MEFFSVAKNNARIGHVLRCYKVRTWLNINPSSLRLRRLDYLGNGFDVDTNLKVFTQQKNFKHNLECSNAVVVLRKMITVLL